MIPRATYEIDRHKMNKFSKEEKNGLKSLTKIQLSKDPKGISRVPDKNSLTQVDEGKKFDVPLPGKETSILTNFVNDTPQVMPARQLDNEEGGPPIVSLRPVARGEPETGDDPTCTRKIRGWLNRLGEKNLELVYEELEKLYYEGRRHEVIGTITRVILETCSDTSNMLEMFMKLYAVFIALMYHIIGIETGNHRNERTMK
jgi:hypothetical protein